MWGKSGRCEACDEGRLIRRSTRGRDIFTTTLSHLAYEIFRHNLRGNFNFYFPSVVCPALLLGGGVLASSASGV